MKPSMLALPDKVHHWIGKCLEEIREWKEICRQAESDGKTKEKG